MAELNMSTETGPVVAPAAPTVIPKAAPKARGPVPVWDPEQQKLKAVPFDQAPQFVEMGYKVGGDAQVEALNNSDLGMAAARASGIANATSAGTFDAALASGALDGVLSGKNTGRGLIRTEQIASEANPKSRFAGEIAGMVGIGAVGGFAAPGAALLGEAAEVGRAATALDMWGGRALTYGARTAQVASEAAPYMAIKGAMDSVTEDSILGHPVTIQHMAANALHSVVEGAGINLFAHGLLKSAGGVRKATGASMDYLEKWGALPRDMVEIPAEYGPGGAPLPTEQTFERRYKVGTDPEATVIPDPVAESTALAKQPGAHDTEAITHLADAIDQHPAPNMAAIVPDAVPGAETMAPLAEPLPDAAHDGTVIPGHYPDFEPPIPMPRKPIREPSSVGSAREQLEKYALEADLKEEVAQKAAGRVESVGKAEIPRATGTAAKEAEEAVEEIPLEDRPLSFKWKKGISPRGKRMKLVEMTKIRLAEAHPEALGMYEKVFQLEREIKDLKNGETNEALDRVIGAKADEKQMLGKRLEMLVPREEDKVLKVIKPSFKDYDQEYARTYGKDRNLGDIAAPKFGPSEVAEEIEKAARKSVEKEMRAAETELKEHKAALASADKSDAAFARAELKVTTAEKKLARLEEAFEVSKKDTTEFLDAKDARTDALARRRHAARVEAQKARDAAKAEVKAANEAKAKAKEQATETRRLEKEAERKAKAAEKKADAAKRQADKDLDRAKKAREKEALRNAPTQGTGNRTKRQWSSSEGVHTETKTTRIKDGFVHEKFHIKVDPHAPPKQYKKGGYKVRWTGSDFGNVAKAGFYTGMPGVSMKVAGAMAGHNALVHMANQREAIGKAWMKYMGGLAKGASVAYKYDKRARSHESHGAMSKEVLALHQYEDLTKAVRYLKENPQAITSYITRNHPALAARKPEVISSVAVGIQKALEQMDQIIPRRPFSPSLQDAGFKPTRAQQIQVLRTWKALGDPAGAVGYGDHTVFGALERAYPDLQQASREMLMHEVQTSKKPIRGRKARQLSQAIGAPVRPVNDAAALKRLQQTAGPEPMKSKGGPGGGMGSGSKSARITNQAVSREATGPQLNQLGA